MLDATKDDIDGEENLKPKRKPKSRPARISPEAMFGLPPDNMAMVKDVQKIIDVCRYDQGNRRAYYQQLNTIVELGRVSGEKSLINLLFRILDRLSSHLCSPAELRFGMDYEIGHPAEVMKRGTTAAGLVGRVWERRNFDTKFAQGVFESLKYGSAIFKQWPKQEGEDRLPVYNASLVMPWQFGVYKPDVDSLDSQPAMCESIPITLPEVWRRIYHMPDAYTLFERIKAHATPGGPDSLSANSTHPVLSSARLQTGVNGGGLSMPGGIVNIGSDPTGARPNGQSYAPTVILNEVWLWNEQDYATIQIIEPDVLVTRFKRSNMLVPGQNSGLHPYTLIQPNQVHGNIWGRSELEDLIEPQGFLSTTASDVQRLFGVQVDKFLGISGDGITDEAYSAAKMAGFLNTGAGATVQDLTPRFPPEAIPLIEKIIQIMEMLSGFDNLLSGKGQTGVRSGEQSNPMMKAAGAPLRDRSLVVERQLASAADLTLSIMEAKDGRFYWTDPDQPTDTAFLLSDLPDDRHVTVDGHTSSPVFADDHESLVLDGLKLGLVDEESAIEQLPFQNKSVLLARLKAKQATQAKLMDTLKKEDPEGFTKVLEHQIGGGKKR